MCVFQFKKKYKQTVFQEQLARSASFSSRYIIQYKFWFFKIKHTSLPLSSRVFAFHHTPSLLHHRTFTKLQGINAFIKTRRIFTPCSDSEEWQVKCRPEPLLSPPPAPNLGLLKEIQGEKESNRSMYSKMFNTSVKKNWNKEKGKWKCFPPESSNRPSCSRSCWAACDKDYKKGKYR